MTSNYHISRQNIYGMMKKRKTREKGVRSVLEEGIVNLLSRAEDEEIDKIISARKTISDLIDEIYNED